MKNKTKIPRTALVILFIIIFAILSYIFLRGSYLEYKELGSAYVKEFFINCIIRYSLMLIVFLVMYVIIYFTNRGIKKGLKEFFDNEKKEMPKLLNKSISLIISLITSLIVANKLTQKFILCISQASFGKTEPLFNFDIGYYIFQKPLLENVLQYIFLLVVGLTIYMALYYIIVFNRYFDGIDGTILRKSKFIKKITRNVVIIAVLIGLGTILNTQNIIFGNITTIENSATTRYDGISTNLELTGANYTNAIIKRWGYTIFGFVITIAIIMAVRYFKKQKTDKVIKTLLVIPAYLIVLFFVMLGFDLIFVNSNKLDKEKIYIANNIDSTINAYGIEVKESSLDYTGTITDIEVNQNQNIIENIPLVKPEAVLTTLEEKQTGTGYYTYRNANLSKYEIEGKNQLVYISPREIVNSGRTYGNKTYEYTHGIGQIITSATTVTENGEIQYLQKEIDGKDDKLGVEEQRIYFGLETNDTVATNAKDRKEYDYTDASGKEYTSNYDGKAGLKLNFLDRLIMGIEKGDINLAFSGEMTNESKILINRNIIRRAEKAMPYLIYDEEPYTVVTDDGKIVWVLDAYTIADNYPFSQYTTIKYHNRNQKINYIRNSVKVLIDAFDGTITYYITDKTDPIVMAYNTIYKGLFKEELPKDIIEHLKYPKFLYKVQAEIIKSYHNVKPDILYRADDIWDFAKFNTSTITQSSGEILEPYYTMVKRNDEEQIGLIQAYTPNEKQNIISYLVGTSDKGKNSLYLYKFSQDSNVVGPMQLQEQIEQDEAISKEIETLNTTGTRVTKNMIVVPLENTILYVEPIYQTKLNESPIPLLKKIVVSSGNKVAIGDTLEKALSNLLSTYAVNIEVENTEDIESLIQSIIKANNNLIESNKNDDWEMVGKDIQRLQDLIKSLEKLKVEKDKEKDKQQDEPKEETENEVNETTNSVLAN